MPRPIAPKNLKRNRRALLAIAVVLLVPIAVYIWTFGPSISSEHTRWSEMGSAMSGIYTPILALLTLGVLVVQVQLQSKLNEHTFDQGYVQDARADTDFYLEQLATEIDLLVPEDSSVRSILVANFAYVTLAQLSEPHMREAARLINRRHHRLVAMWSALYGILAGLKANDYPPYNNNYVTAKHKAVAMLSYECCAALDNLLWTVSEGRLSYVYEFSDVLPPSSHVA